MSEWIEAGKLADLVDPEPAAQGHQSLRELLEANPKLLLPLGEATSPPVDLSTYRIRFQRDEEEEGPELHGMQEFLRVAEGDSPSRLVSVQGTETNYKVLLDEEAGRILAVLAIDRPEQRR